jgi:hypothetical protein
MAFLVIITISFINLFIDRYNERFFLTLLRQFFLIPNDYCIYYISLIKQLYYKIKTIASYMKFRSCDAGVQYVHRPQQHGVCARGKFALSISKYRYKYFDDTDYFTFKICDTLRTIAINIMFKHAPQKKNHKELEEYSGQDHPTPNRPG